MMSSFQRRFFAMLVPRSASSDHRFLPLIPDDGRARHFEAHVLRHLELHRLLARPW